MVTLSQTYINNNIIENTQEVIKKIISSINESVNNFYNESKEKISEIKFNLNKDKLFKSINNYLFNLKELDEFKEEYFDFILINDMLENVLNKSLKNISIEHINFLSELFNLFFDLIDFKIDLIKKNNFKLSNEFFNTYSFKYSKFEELFKKYQYYFLDNICDKYSRNQISSNEDKFSIFYNELLNISNHLGLGDNISIEDSYDGPAVEKVFTIKAPFKLNGNIKDNYSSKIFTHMGIYSRNYNLFDIFEYSYIFVE